jgi:hypothetical protein
MDIYDQADQGGTDAAARWFRIRTRPFGLEWARDFARRHNKLFAIPELGLNYTASPGFTRDNTLFLQGAWDALRASDVAYYDMWEYPGPQRLSETPSANPNTARLYLNLTTIPWDGLERTLELDDVDRGLTLDPGPTRTLELT